MLKLKTRISSINNLYSAAQYRVQDYFFLDLSTKEIDSGVASYLKRDRFFFEQPLRPAVPMSSATWREYLRDLRFLIVFSNLEINSLEKDIFALAKRNYKKIKTVQRELNILESEVIEEELKFYRDFDFVHHNNFSKKKDRNTVEVKDWNYDFKTGLSLANDNLSEVYPFAGAILPVIEALSIPVSNCIVVGEETDVGDTQQPLIKTNPNFCVMDNEIFRYVIIRREFDETKRKYSYTESFLTLLLDFGNIQTVNFFEVVPAGANSLQIASVTYLNESNEEVPIGTEVLDVPSGLKIFMEPIRVRYLKLKFKQSAPVNKQSLLNNNGNGDLNVILRGLDWSSKFREDSFSQIEGRVYDFSIKDIKVWLNKYNSLGYYCSDVKEIKHMATAKVDSSLEEIPVVTGVSFSDLLYSYTTGSTSAEFYLGIKSKQLKKNKNFFEDLIPLQDSFPIQTETLVINGGYAKLKLYPNLTFEVPKLLVNSIEHLSGVRYLITTSLPHELVEDEEFFMIGPMGKDVTDTFTVFSVVNDYTIEIRPTVASNLVIDEETKPNTYLFKSNVVPTFTLTKSGADQVIGTNYQVSFGDGIYYDTWDYSKYTEWLVRGPRAGDFSLRIKDPSYIETYSIDYRPLKNQWLGQTNLVRLKHGAAVFDPKFKDSLSEVQTIALLRSSTPNYYTTSVLTSYTLGIKRF
jgi:hypothetical protein